MSGPSYCSLCDAWPAPYAVDGMTLCHLCESRLWCQKHPSPLPKNPEMLADLASIGISVESEGKQ